MATPVHPLKNVKPKVKVVCHIKETGLEIFSREWDFNFRDESPSFRNIYDEIFFHELWSHRNSAMYRIDTTEICMTYHPLSQSWTVGGNTISCEKLDVITSTEC